MNDLAGTISTSALDGSPAACLTRARSLIPLLRSAADRIDANNELPPDVLDAMHEAGLFRLLLPIAYGGFELRPVDFIQCVEAVAEGDASAAWCMNQGSGCSMASAYVAPAVAREVWGGKRDVLAWGQGPGAKAIRTDGGWRVTGTWTFASGSRHATWLGAMCPSFEGDGTPIRHPDGKAWERTFLFRREQARIEDVWQVMGLRGTGSDTYIIENLFVDDAHAMTREYEPERRAFGPLYTFQAMQLYATGFASVALGVSRAMLDAFVDLAKTKSQAWSTDQMRDNQAVQNIIGYSDAAWKAARAGLHKVVDAAWDDVSRAGELTLDQRIQIRQASTYGIHVSRDLCHAVFHEAGSTAVFASQPFERRLRDVNSVSQQTQGRRTHFETVGLYMLGGAPNPRWL
ncbi:acyl-CoA dehydrogenase family protein [Rhodopila sp.]|uniref:acyl-CoA dehydrogenase family protein n=1 Tax=Rhodopila sp. TaxID=2480087 RepID=UPI003D0A2949